MDAFSEVLNAVKLEGALFFHAEFSEPWRAAESPSSDVAPVLVPGAEHVIIYHLVIEGEAYAQLPGAEPVRLTAGEIVIFPHGDAHALGNGGACESMDPQLMLEHVIRRDLQPMRAGGGGDVTRLVCGYLACDPDLCRPILNALPRLMKVNIRAGASGGWLEDSIRRLVAEVGSSTPGSQAMLAKLSEALFVETMRQYVNSLPPEDTGWLAGARDPVIGRSLAILHSRVQHPWTIADLAKEVGLSRSALVERFAQYLGEPPMAYLTRWRLQLAARSLESTPKGVAQIASEVGYESEAAFNRAFKRQYGVPPARFRRERRATPASPSPASSPNTDIAQQAAP